jgi:putative hydrolase of HD superfamily
MKISEVSKFAKQVGMSKRIKRTGWVREGVEDPESVAEHSFRLVVLSMALGKFLNVDTEKLVKMAIIHDLGETSTGDLVVERGKKIDSALKKEKEAREEQAISDLFISFGEEYRIIFQEMIKRESKESQIFWQLDKLEMAMQAKDYEKEQGMVLTEFIENARIHITEKFLKDILQEISK